MTISVQRLWRHVGRESVSSRSGFRLLSISPRICAGRRSISSVCDLDRQRRLGEVYPPGGRLPGARLAANQLDRLVGARLAVAIEFQLELGDDFLADRYRVPPFLAVEGFQRDVDVDRRQVASQQWDQPDRLYRHLNYRNC